MTEKPLKPAITDYTCCFCGREPAVGDEVIFRCTGFEADGTPLVSVVHQACKQTAGMAAQENAN